MTDDIKDAILGLHNGDSAQFKDVVNSTLMNKAKDAIQLQRIYAGQTMFDDEKEEEVEVEQESEDDPESSEEISDEEI